MPRKPAAKPKPAASRAPEAPLRTQRKIHHLLASREFRGDFQYLLQHNPKTGFADGDNVLLTEKWDGTTVQATNRGFFKRLDTFGAGDPEKHEADEEQRYRLVPIDLEDAANAHIRRGAARYEEVFRRMEDGLCCYFEACADNIGARFSHLNWADIRVFDFAMNGEYLPFEDAIMKCEELDLPLVAYVDATLNIPDVVHRLEQGLEYTDVHAPLEGYVIRDTTEQGRIAKIRVNDLPKIYREPPQDE
ncbi:hypothetical protein PAPYR_4032 [Paratrimastix pyriformis]|uniref:RNA ligase domain-containing protein n=1 Tax=Paratrimastix pyriformis TaxID=342808 RepID=A0ABQ8UL70_9EUKA|nr:hypothetical protein PAPYR_4032 [Paratrimastix pyriformis]